MNKGNPFDAAACFARLRRASERLNEIFTTLAEIGRAFENTPALKIDSVEEVAILLDMLSENRLARALAEEGLTLIDQIASEVTLYKRDPQVPETPELRSAEQLLESVKASAEARRDELAAFRLSNEQIMETTMKDVQRMTGTLENIAGRLKKEM